MKFAGDEAGASAVPGWTEVQKFSVRAVVFAGDPAAASAVRGWMKVQEFSARAADFVGDPAAASAVRGRTEVQKFSARTAGFACAAAFPPAAVLVPGSSSLRRILPRIKK